MDAHLVEMKNCRSKGLCCGAGGAQMFKEAEPGAKEVFEKRTSEALATGASVVASACPFCMTMLSDGIKNEEKESEVEVRDIVEIVAESLNL